MLLKRIVVRNSPPVRLFEATDLSNVVVLAGPNGVGKTRLLRRMIDQLRSGAVTEEFGGRIEATCSDEVKLWGKADLNLSEAADVQLLVKTLQLNRRRRNLHSSLVNIESDRTIQNLQPLVYSFDMPDPEEEDTPWDLSMGFMRDRYQDTVHSMFRMIESQKSSIVGRAIELQRQGHKSMQLKFLDPMQPFKEIFSLLLAPKELVDPSAREQRLFYEIDGQKFEFTSLSSGEREVVNIAFDFLLRNPRDCIVFFDEPELHLHPELSYRLIQTLQHIGENNQFILSTHSPDVITASLDRSVIFLSPPAANPDEEFNQAIQVGEADATNQALRLLGQSVGIISLGKRIVLIEGEESSLDKHTYGSIIRNRWPGLVLVPSGGKHVIESFSVVYDRVLSKTLWGVDFFMLCDRDSAPQPTEAAAAQTTGRLRVLSKYHLENYFLDENVWAEAFAPMEPEDSWLRSPAKIRARLRADARDLVCYATALAATTHVRQLAGNVNIMPKDCHGKNSDEIAMLLENTASAETTRLGETLDVAKVRQFAAEYHERLVASLDADDDTWKDLTPGKPLLSRFAHAAGMQTARAKTAYVNTAERSASNPFSEILQIFQGFADLT